ncbi:MAG TPA: TetR/AcrR family transcriptional regulator [Deltaproteobacteria bacterium]|jgi:AcrR family transcriptional regulator|nr:TetR/AcrR family transcriptional regulator [Deltaproteobacteria bacterium]HOI06882.1 TetR/AcrR family transcriptional regulator [Deltaproteobacteria bacterium]
MARKSVREERKRQILRALDQCLLEKSFAQTSIKDISRVAQVNHGVLHYYFQSKEDILLHYIDYVVDDFKARVQEVLTPERRGTMSRKDFVKEVFSFANSRITLNRNLSKIFVEIWEIALYNEVVRKKLREAYREWIRILTDKLGGSAEGEAASVLSLSMVAFWEGMALFSTIFEDGELDVAVVLDRFQQRILEIL